VPWSVKQMPIIRSMDQTFACSTMLVLKAISERFLVRACPYTGKRLIALPKTMGHGSEISTAQATRSSPPLV